MRLFKLGFMFAALLAVFSFSSCKSGDKSGDTKLTGYIKLDAKGFKSAIEANAPAQILDYRSAADYAKGHIEGAINIDASNAADWKTDNGPFIQQLVSTFDTNKKIFIYGNSGWNAVGMSLPGRIADTWGEKNTYNLEGGYNSWVKAGY